MISRALTDFVSPQLKKIHSGKVRESFRLDQKHRLLMATDRLSCFDKILKTPLVDKGRILTGLSAFWFEKTRHMIANHYCKMVDPCVSLVKEASPIPLEIIVRGYLCGSLWRRYEKR